MKQNNLGQVFKLLGLLPLAFLVSACQGVPLLNPQGPIGTQERDLILMAVGLSLIVIIPVFVMVAWFAIRYRETNKKATYKPHWEGNFKIEALIWLIPILIISVLAYLTWVKTTDLDPYKPIPSAEKPIHVQVVSLDWNWLFLYPEENLASVNNLVVPAGVPVVFDLTSATVMSSFFIPDLGSQIYAMAGMVTHLNLLADRPGKFVGHNLEFSGVGYSSMNFTVNALTKEQFEAWKQTAKGQGNSLTQEQFDKMNTPKSGLPADTFGSVESNLFGKIVAKFMSAKATTSGAATDAAMPMPDEKK